MPSDFALSPVARFPYIIPIKEEKTVKSKYLLYLKFLLVRTLMFTLFHLHFSMFWGHSTRSKTQTLAHVISKLFSLAKTSCDEEVVMSFLSIDLLVKHTIIQFLL